MQRREDDVVGDDAVEVRRGSLDGRRGEPAHFLWRGRLFMIRSVLDHWVESGTWCLSPVPADAGDGRLLAVLDAEQALVGLGDEREFWLVEAAPGRHASTDIFRLGFDPASTRWTLRGPAVRWYG